MDLSSVMSLDWQVWDNVDPVRLEIARTPAAPGVNSNRVDFIQTAKRRNLTVRELAASGGAYTGQDRVWLIPQALLAPGVEPKPADVVIDRGGRRWTALEVGLGKFGQTWRLTCRDLVLALALRDTVYVERAGLSQDAAGAPVKAWPTGPAPNGGSVVYTLPARVQVGQEEVREERGIRGPVLKCSVIIGQQAAVSTEDRLRWVDPADGQTKYLDVLGYHDARQIDLLPTLDCEIRP